VPALLFCFLSFSQTKDSIGNRVKNIFAFNYKFDSLSVLKPNFNYQYKTTDTKLFSVYDRNSKLNSDYYLTKNSVYFVKSVNLNANQLIPKDSFQSEWSE